jgi:hypothetical protein
MYNLHYWDFHLCDTDVIKLPGCILDVVSSGFKKLTSRQREQLLVHLFHVWINSTPDCLNFGTNFVPCDFLPLVMKAMSVLQSAAVSEKKALEWIFQDFHWIECLSCLLLTI